MPATPHDASASLVLVGSSLGPASDGVVRAALLLTRQVGGRLVLLHVLEPRGEVAAGLLRFPMVRDGLVAAARERLAAQLHRFGALPGEVAEIAVGLPPAGETMLAAISARSAAGVIVGAGGETPHAHRLGLVATRLARRSPAPLWLVKGEVASMPETVALPIDLALHGLDDIRHALAVLARWVSLDTTALSVFWVLGRRGEEEDDVARRELHLRLAGAPAPVRSVESVVGWGAVAGRVAAAPADVLLLAVPRGGWPRSGCGSALESLLGAAHRAALLVPAMLVPTASSRAAFTPALCARPASSLSRSARGRRGRPAPPPPERRGKG